MKDFKDWLIVHFAEAVKLFTGAMMYATAFFMIYDRVVDSEILPSYFQFSIYDWWAWVIALTTLATLNIFGILFVDIGKARLIGDLVLQVSGIALLIIGWAFIVHYPPAHWLMVFYPVWGMTTIIAGRHMGRRSRLKLKEY